MLWALEVDFGPVSRVVVLGKPYFTNTGPGLRSGVDGRGVKVQSERGDGSLDFCGGCFMEKRKECLRGIIHGI